MSRAEKQQRQGAAAESKHLHSCARQSGHDCCRQIGRGPPTVEADSNAGPALPSNERAEGPSEDFDIGEGQRLAVGAEDAGIRKQFACQAAFRSNRNLLKR